MTEPVNYVLDADIKGFFDSVGHEKLMRCLRKRICDPRLPRLVVRFLKAKAMNEWLRRSFDWPSFAAYLERYPLPRPRIYHNGYYPKATR